MKSLVKINCILCDKELWVTKKAATRQKYCKECSKKKHREYVDARYEQEKQKRYVGEKLCSCGCGRPIGEGLRFLSDYCYKTKDNDIHEEHKRRD